MRLLLSQALLLAKAVNSSAVPLNESVARKLSGVLADLKPINKPVRPIFYMTERDSQLEKKVSPKRSKDACRDRIAEAKKRGVLALSKKGYRDLISTIEAARIKKISKKEREILLKLLSRLQHAEASSPIRLYKSNRIAIAGYYVPPGLTLHVTISNTAIVEAQYILCGKEYIAQ